MDLRGRLLEMLQAQESSTRGSRDDSSFSDSGSSASRRGSSFSSSPHRRSRRDRRRSRRSSRSRSSRRHKERNRRSSRDHRRGRRRDRSRSRDRRGRERYRGGRPRVGENFSDKRAPDSRPRLGDNFRDKRAPDGRPYCIDFKLGRCKRPDCRYYHSKQEPCMDFRRGRCTYGDRCKFKHDRSKRPRSKSPRSPDEEEALARRRAERRGVKYESGSSKQEQTSKPSSPLPSLVEATKFDVDVTKSEPTEYVDDLELTKDVNNENELNEDGEISEDVIAEEPEQAEDVIEEEPEHAEDGEMPEDHPALADIPDEPMECNADVDAGETVEITEASDGTKPAEAESSDSISMKVRANDAELVEEKIDVEARG